MPTQVQSYRLRARPPFITWPVQVCDPRFGFAWYAHPAVFVTQVIVPHATVEVATAALACLDAVIAFRGDDFRSRGGLAMVHDWRAVKGYDREARQLIIGRTRQRTRGYARSVVVAIDTDNALLRLAIEMLNLAASVALNTKVHVVSSPEVALQQWNVRPPRPGESFPGHRRA